MREFNVDFYYEECEVCHTRFIGKGAERAKQIHRQEEHDIW